MLTWCQTPKEQTVHARSHNDARRTAVTPAPSLVVVQVRQLLAVDGPAASVANVFYRLDWILVTTVTVANTRSGVGETSIGAWPPADQIKCCINNEHMIQPTTMMNRLCKNTYDHYNETHNRAARRTSNTIHPRVDPSGNRTRVRQPSQQGYTSSPGTVLDKNQNSRTSHPPRSVKYRHP